MLDLKIVAAILVGVLAVFGGLFSYFADQTTLDEKMSSFMSNPTGYILGSGVGAKKTVEFTAVLDSPAIQDIEFSFSEPVESITTNYEPAERVFTINSLALKSTGNTRVEIKDYQGYLKLSGDLTLNGKAKEVEVNQVSMDHGTEKMTVKTTDLVFNSVSLNNMPKTSINLLNISGTMIVEEDGDRISYDVSNKAIALKSFEGSMTINSNRITLEGKGTFRTSILSTPA